MLDFFNFEGINDEQTMLSGHINLEFLKPFTGRGTMRIDRGGLIRKHVDEMRADYSDLYFLDDEVSYYFIQ